MSKIGILNLQGCKDDFSLKRQYEIKQNIDNLKKIHETGYNNKILKELNKQINLLSYNKKHIVEKTWNKLKNYPIDEEEDKNYWLEIAKETLPKKNEPIFNFMNSDLLDSESE